MIEDMLEIEFAVQSTLKHIVSMNVAHHLAESSQFKQWMSSEMVASQQ
jgi:hypothetical protein